MVEQGDLQSQEEEKQQATLVEQGDLQSQATMVEQGDLQSQATLVKQDPKLFYKYARSQLKVKETVTPVEDEQGTK